MTLVNLATNPSFERFRASDVRPYVSYGPGLTAVVGIGGTAGVTSSPEWKAEGSRSVKIVAATSSASSVYPFGTSCPLATAGLVPGKTYQVSAYLHLPAPLGYEGHYARRSISVGMDTGSGMNLEYAQAPVPPNTPGTHLVSCAFTVPTNAVAFTIRLMNGSNVPGDTVYWDMLTLTEGPHDLPFTGDTPPRNTDGFPPGKIVNSWGGGASHEHL